LFRRARSGGSPTATRARRKTAPRVPACMWRPERLKVRHLPAFPAGPLERTRKRRRRASTSGATWMLSSGGYVDVVAVLLDPTRTRRHLVQCRSQVRCTPQDPSRVRRFGEYLAFRSNSPFGPRWAGVRTHGLMIRYAGNRFVYLGPMSLLSSGRLPDGGRVPSATNLLVLRAQNSSVRIQGIVSTMQ
jgi:hypothetical protein